MFPYHARRFRIKDRVVIDLLVPRNTTRFTIYQKRDIVVPVPYNMIVFSNYSIHDREVRALGQIRGHQYRFILAPPIPPENFEAYLNNLDETFHPFFNSPSGALNNFLTIQTGRERRDANGLNAFGFCDASVQSFIFERFGNRMQHVNAEVALFLLMREELFSDAELRNYAIQYADLSNCDFSRFFD